MAVILINPNSTETMTQAALAAAQSAAPEVAFQGWTSHDGPPAIEGAADGAHAVPPLLELVQKASDQGADLIIIACFDDTGLAQAQELAQCPVIGIGQASYTLASLMTGPTAVVTTVEAAVPVIKANIKAQGHSVTVGHVVAAQVPVLQLDHDPTAAAQAFETTAQHLPPDTANLILGCAGAVSIVDLIRPRVSMQVIDGVTAAARLSRALVA